MPAVRHRRGRRLHLVTRPVSAADRHTAAFEASVDEVERQALRLLVLDGQRQHHYVWENANRVGLLWAHGLAGLITGTLMLMFGTASTIEAEYGVAARSVMAGFGILGGVLLVGGLTRRPRRSIRLEASGLGCLMVWDLVMMAGFAALIAQRPPQILAPWEPLPEGTALPYPIAIYGALLVLLALHLVTLRGIVRIPEPTRG